MIWSVPLKPYKRRNTNKEAGRKYCKILNFLSLKKKKKVCIRGKGHRIKLLSLPRIYNANDKWTQDSTMKMLFTIKLELQRMLHFGERENT